MKQPTIHPSAFVAPNATVLGDVQIGARSSVWFGAVIRGDEAPIRIGDETSVQDNCTFHGDQGKGTTVGNRVTVGHNAVVHAATVGDDCIIGMGAIILSGATVGKNCIVGAGAVIKENDTIPDNSLVLGIPATVVRQLTDKERERIKQNAHVYVDLAQTYSV
ncbi:MAG: gamma carbonic anhydrase family protein [Nanoarchaeota archaeon]|nr:gamma carbonic anhydrase family protein [Nanoarchaeota archaeon]